MATNPITYVTYDPRDEKITVPINRFYNNQPGFSKLYFTITLTGCWASPQVWIVTVERFGYMGFMTIKPNEINATTVQALATCSNFLQNEHNPKANSLAIGVMDIQTADSVAPHRGQVWIKYGGFGGFTMGTYATDDGRFPIGSKIGGSADDGDVFIFPISFVSPTIPLKVLPYQE
jgi:hypothetical protein